MDICKKIDDLVILPLKIIFKKKKVHPATFFHLRRLFIKEPI